MSASTLLLRQEMFSGRKFAEPDVPYPWLMAGADAEPFDEPGSLVVPAPGSGHTEILVFRCPVGFQGVLLGHQHQYFGSGYIQGGGDLFWRISIDGNFPRSLGSIPFEMGSLERPRPVYAPVRFSESQVITYFIDVPPGSAVATGPGNFTIAALSGYLWPMESRRQR
ncbi:hypothetical protein J4558_25270 [Leptolyngbya sp. 15MV]|nr:hypothetical protein J4558_25270 [Leptolyngbya sp. 15MV]